MTRNKGQRVEACPFEPMLDYIFVADYGKPNMTRGGIYMPQGAEHDYPAYKFSLWRYGEVLAIGPGRPAKTKSGFVRSDGGLVPMPDLKLGDVVMFSRKHGTRTGYRYKHPVLTTKRWSEDLSGLLIRVLDPDKIVCVHDDFKPWWDPEECTPVTPDQIMSG